MKILTLHSNFIEFTPIEKAVKEAEEVKKDKERFEDCLVVFSAVEETDEINPSAIAKNASVEIKNICEKVDCDKILLYPYVHLTKNPSDALTARKVLNEIKTNLKNLNVSKAPFGWYKSFTISVKGHPLSELSREITAESETRKPIKKEYKIFTPSGKIYSPDNYKYKKGEEDFKVLVEKEALGIDSPGGKEPEYIKHSRKLGIDWESMSDIGHMRYNPVGNLIYELVARYSKEVVESLGIPVYSVRGTNMFNLAEKPIKEHANLFGDRLYDFKVGNRRMVMRYAACFQQFAIIKDWTISYKNLPFAAFEVADSYRLEQSGELLLTFRVRRMNMPDLHVFCKDINESKKWFYKLHERIYSEIRDLNQDYVSLYNLTSREFFEENKEFFKKLVKHEKKPVLLCFYPEAKYYWKLNIEYNIIDKLRRPREIGTIQIDVGNAERFGIQYTDKNNKQEYPIILHSAVIGTIERYLYTLFDSAMRMKNPFLPVWISPTQIRLCPINDKLVKYSEKIADELEKNNIRVDIDNRTESIQKKVRDSETDWVPFIVVIGEREKKSGKLAVRYRKTGKVDNISINNLIKRVKERTKDFPFKKLSLPRLLSKRPSFI
jgi:threonyl-tRNA synthetase